MSSTTAAPLLAMKSISKRFPGVLALDGVDLELYEGEILGLIGENGAGKSTLMRILGGDYEADEGTICFAGETVHMRDVRDAIALGVSVIYQELNLAPNLDIASNIFLGREPRGGPMGIVDRGELYARAAGLAARVGIEAPLTTIVDDLSPGERQLVEVAKALSMDARILVLDEPTSSLSPSEAEKLFAVMRSLRENRVSMIYISHRLNEVEEMCDRVVVLRDGQRVGGLEREHVHPDEMVKLMVGRDISRFFPEHGEKRDGEIVLSVRNFRCACGKCDASFDLRAGEILGIAGLVGAGRTEFVTSLFGIDPPERGEVSIRGKRVDIKSPVEAIRMGMALVPEDRKQLGVILEMAVGENISLPGIGSYSPPFMDRKREAQVVDQMVDALEIKTPNTSQQVQFLSGGNQQKVALAKWLSLDPGILILDEPTRGIDVGSKSEIYKLIRKLADDGLAVIMVSSEMEEVIGLADRVMVMHEGTFTGTLDGADISEENIMHLATGGTGR